MLYKFYSVGIVKQEEFKEFENAIINHTPKIKLFQELIAGTSVVSQNKEKVRDMVLNQKKSIREVLESLQKEMEEDEVWRIFETANQAKKAAFYVEVSSNKLSIPKNVISEELVRKTIKALREKAIFRFRFFLKSKASDFAKAYANTPSLFQGSIDEETLEKMSEE